jgi:myotubularin-related protein 6/7/8
LGSFRSKVRIPALSYIHKENAVSITRSAQPMTGLTQNRSLQDEKLVECIFSSSNIVQPTGPNLIIDARPTANALAQTAMVFFSKY